MIIINVNNLKKKKDYINLRICKLASSLFKKKKKKKKKNSRTLYINIINH